MATRDHYHLRPLPDLPLDPPEIDEGRGGTKEEQFALAVLDAIDEILSDLRSSLVDHDGNGEPTGWERHDIESAIYHSLDAVKALAIAADAVELDDEVGRLYRAIDKAASDFGIEVPQ